MSGRAGSDHFAATFRAQLPDSASSSSDPDGHVDDLAAKVGKVLGDVYGTELVGERWKYCANYPPMLSEHGCERLSA